MIERYREIQRQKAAGEREDGFTLIELLIVIVVLGILAAVVVFALGSVTSKSAKSACAADAKTVETGVAAYQANGGLTASISQSTLTTGTTATLKSWPSNPGHYFIGLNLAGNADPSEVDVNATSATAAPATGASNGWIKYDVETTANGCNAVT